MSSRQLIVNADDFGLSAGVNRGIIEAHQRGIVTSASLMVRKNAAEEAAAYARQNTELGVGIHIDLGEWEYAASAWHVLYEVAPADVEAEVAQQLEMFRTLVGHDPTHLDSHQHVHREEPIHSILLRLAQALDVPLRQYSPHVQYRGDFYGQDGRGAPFSDGIKVQALLEILEDLPEGVTELGCHPGYSEGLAGVYAQERELELAALTDAAVVSAVIKNGIELRSFAGLHGIRLAAG